MSRTNIWFPFYIGDYRAETQGFSYEERGIFIELLCAYCYRQSPLPDDDTQLAKLTGLTMAKWKRVRKVIAPLFTIEQGTWRLERLDEQIAHSLEVRETKRRAGRLGGQKSWANRQAYAGTNATNESKHMLNKSKSKSKGLPVVLPEDRVLSKTDPDFEKILDSDSVIKISTSGGFIND